VSCILFMALVFRIAFIAPADLGVVGPMLAFVFSMVRLRRGTLYLSHRHTQPPAKADERAIRVISELTGSFMTRRLISCPPPGKGMHFFTCCTNRDDKATLQPLARLEEGYVEIEKSMCKVPQTLSVDRSRTRAL